MAYITLVCGEVVTDGRADLVGPDVNYRYKSYPAVKIARLAVDRRHRSRGLGAQLMEFALGTVKDRVCPAVGCRFVMVDSKKNAVDFYKRCGFTFLDTQLDRERPEPVLFIDLHKTPVA